MPNGHQGSAGERASLEAPLVALDPALAEFAGARGLEVATDARGWPGRSLAWREDGLERRIEIALQDDDPPTYTLWIGAWVDEEDVRWGADRALLERVPGEDLPAEVVPLLPTAWDEVRAWTRDDLAPWVDLEDRRGGARLVGWILFLIAGALVVWGADLVLERLLGL